MLGGTFDPVHRGHLALALAAREFLGLEQLRLVPARVPPHRATPGANDRQRLSMLQLAVQGCDGLLIDDMELVRSGPSYSLLSVLQLRQRFPGHLPVLVLGWDSFASLPGWHQWQELAGLTAFLVYHRAGHQPELPQQLGKLLQPAEFPQQAGQYCSLQANLPRVSASQVRQCVQRGEPVEGLVPTEVGQFIESEGLYQQLQPQSMQEDI